jgi:hypothetical protein
LTAIRRVVPIPEAVGRLSSDAEEGVRETAQPLAVEFCGDRRTISPGESLMFGRGAELDIDSNPQLHRQLGQLLHRDGWWWLQNVGRSIPMRLADPSTGATTLLPSGTQTALTHRHTYVGFDAGISRYELTLLQEGITEVAAPGMPLGSTRTNLVEELPLNTEQRQLLAALCESRLRDPASPLVLPSNRSIAQRLGWPLTKLNRKLDWLCARYARQGVAGLQSTTGRATDRRRTLAEWVLTNGLITTSDLEQLP